MNLLRGIFSSLLFLMWTALLVPPYLLCFPLGRTLSRPFVNVWHKGACALTGLKVKCHGHPHKGQTVLLAGNHISYLDIPVLASLLDVTFVAKADVANWPLFGFLARIAQTAFIERRPSKARQQKADLKKRLVMGERLMIFPEGTSSDGSKVLPFKSALFEMVMEEDMRDECYVQPITIAFVKDKKGHFIDQARRDHFAWYGDMTLMPHLWHVFCHKSVQVDVIFHPPLLAHSFEERKSLAHWVEEEVRSGLHTLMEKPLPENSKSMKDQDPQKSRDPVQNSSNHKTTSA